MLKKLIIGGALAMLIAAPAFAQSYDPEYGTGNVINLPLAEATNGALGIGANVSASPQQGTSAYAYAPRVRHVRHRAMRRHHMR
jgi:hypothetical protein